MPTCNNCDILLKKEEEEIANLAATAKDKEIVRGLDNIKDIIEGLED